MEQGTRMRIAVLDRLHVGGRSITFRIQDTEAIARKTGNFTRANGSESESESESGQLLNATAAHDGMYVYYIEIEALSVGLVLLDVFESGRRVICLFVRAHMCMYYVCIYMCVCMHMCVNAYTSNVGAVCALSM
jgi:hypothetical protein